MKRLDLWIEPSVYKSRTRLPGHVRQRVKREISSLADDPRPHASRTLDVTGLDVPTGMEFRRLRLERWRIVYVVNEAEGWVWVLALRQRPPYDYEDLSELTDWVGE